MLPAFAWPGAYPIIYVTEDADILCAECAWDVAVADEPLTQDIHWEGPTLCCDDCSKPIESAYGDPEADDETMRCPHGMFYSGAGACPMCGRGAEPEGGKSMTTQHEHPTGAVAHDENEETADALLEAWDTFRGWYQHAQRRLGGNPRFEAYLDQVFDKDSRFLGMQSMDEWLHEVEVALVPERATPTRSTR